MSTAAYTVTGMSCSHCEHAIRAELSEIPAITAVSVDATTGHLSITSTSPVPHEDILAAVDEAGYEATPA